MCLSLHLSTLDPAQLGGPIWAEAIHDAEFVKGLLSATKAAPTGTYHTIQRITGLLTVISEVSIRVKEVSIVWVFYV